MKYMLKEENIQFLDHVSNWKEAIYLSVEPLIKQHYVEARYPDEIIKNTEKFGPYYVLCENLALLHAGADQGVIEKQIAVTILKHPIRFKEDGFDVRILITLAASDPDSHMHVMQVISTIFSSKSYVQNLLELKTKQEVYQYLLSFS